MEATDTKKSSGYGKPPWIFKGSALYQLHLVKAETARLFVPKEFRLVEAFGYTLGGFFLARYQDSPAGVFDELVVIAGTVWNPPTSCAWAARVLVSSDDACNHGRKDVGLPSQVAKFSQRVTAVPKEERSNAGGFLNMIGLVPERSVPEDRMVIEVTEIDGPSATDICNINLPVPGLKLNKWMGPAIEMSLPSFSGHTQYNRNLLKYSCHIRCRVKPVQPAIVSGPSLAPKHGEEEDSTTGEMDTRRYLSISILLSKPILALEFSCLTMQVQAPIVISDAEPI